ncbi:uncharacterized protein LOC128929324, partial [Callithrix jacchus]|uniref:translation initiation factor IF-2 n=1 Tax=Callithrix jacchus TaxID=9483 RepID=UPI0023DD171F
GEAAGGSARLRGCGGGGGSGVRCPHAAAAPPPRRRAPRRAAPSNLLLSAGRVAGTPAAPRASLRTVLLARRRRLGRAGSEPWRPRGRQRRRRAAAAKEACGRAAGSEGGGGGKFGSGRAEAAGARRPEEGRSGPRVEWTADGRGGRSRRRRRRRSRAPSQQPPRTRLEGRWAEGLTGCQCHSLTAAPRRGEGRGGRGRGSAPQAPPPGRCARSLGPAPPAAAAGTAPAARPVPSGLSVAPALRSAPPDSRSILVASSPPEMDLAGLETLCRDPDAYSLLLAVMGAGACVWDRGQLAPKPTVYSPRRTRELHASDNAWCTFPLFRSGGVALWVPGRSSRANRKALGAERGGTEARKRCPNWSVRKVLGRGGEAASGGPAPPAVAMVTERAPLNVGASTRAWCCPSRSDQLRW